MILTCFIGCVQPFEVDFPENDKILVISGVLTNADKTHYVNISYTRSLNEASDIPDVIDAEVSVEDEFGNVVIYLQEGAGRYISPTGFKAEIGVKYQLKVLHEGQLFVSEQVKLVSPTEIENVHWDPKEVIDSDLEEVVHGAQFFIDSEESQNKYFRYEWEGTHLIIPPFSATHEVVDRQIVEIDFVPTPCYSTGYSNNLLLATTIGLSQPRVLDVPIHFIPETDSKLRHAYSLLVRQYSLTESAYNYYKQLKDNNESSGSFFDAQQGSIVGNIKNDSDPESLVLGYFEVSGESSKRKKFTRGSDFKSQIATAAFPFYCGEIIVCDEDTGECGDIVEGTPEEAIENITLGFADYIYQLDTSAMPQTAFVQRRGCTDCSYYATTDTPDFWYE
ncbi:MAG: DUF4249 domain-containing protein [Cyclobacteriaceae bacterium]